MNFSYFNPPITNTIPTRETTLEETYQMITSDNKLKKLTEEVRSGTKSKDDDLPYITPSGLFKRRKMTGLVNYTGTLCIDLDGVDTGLKTSLQSDAFFRPCLVFVSPSGNGLKVFYQITDPGRDAINRVSTVPCPEDHRLYFEAIAAYLQKTYRLMADDHCKDIPRPCWLCHDADAYYNPDSTVEAKELINYAVETRSVETRLIASLQPAASVETRHCLVSTEQPRATTQAAPGEETLNSHPFLHPMAISALNKAGWKENGDRWTRPGKDKCTSAVFNYYEPYGCNIFYCFSSNGKPFEEKKGYNDLGVICMLEYNNDMERCIQSLCEQLDIPVPPVETRLIASLPAPATELDYFHDRSIREVIEEGLKERDQHKIGGAFLYEDTTTYLFSRTNYGKSLLVFQLAYAAATGTSLARCAALQNDCPPMKVLVVDLELEPRVLSRRHGDVIKKDNLLLSNLRYLHERMDKNVSTGLALLAKIEQYAMKHEAQLVIIDNISKLLPDSLKPDVVTGVIDALNKIRQRTGASMLVIGHTIKGNPKVAIQPTDYFGSSMVQNFFSELAFLDMTTDGRFFLCHTKTKQKECYTETVPVFTRGDHPVVGVGFTYETMQSLADIQLPYMLLPKQIHRKRNLNDFKKEISILDHAGVNRTTIADMFGVSRQAIYKIFEAS